jgi:aryl-alcohol dehydrogenase-like predicted oxidoreductase
MDAIAATHGKTLAQVAINWLSTNEEVSIIPIPGMKTAKQAADNLGALGWALTREERARIHEAEQLTR